MTKQVEAVEKIRDSAEKEHKIRERDGGIGVVNDMTSEKHIGLKVRI